MENPKYSLMICYTDGIIKNIFADNILFYDNYISILRHEDCVMIVPFSSIKYLLSKRFKA